MNINADLNKTAHLMVEDFEWIPSPLPGVERVMLDRVGDEVAVATSIVRYAPNANFSAHSHALGEEFIVLDGVFSDEHADYPAGTYVRNPPGTSHTPHSDPGCIIFVKLRQFADDDLQQMVASTKIESASESQNHNQNHKKERILYQHNDEVVSVVRIEAGERYAFSSSFYTRELLLLEGEVTWQQEITRTLKPWSWIRMAPGDPLRVTAKTSALLFSKTRPVYRPAG